MMKNTFVRLLISALGCTAFMITPSVMAEDEWEWTVAPYLWASSVGLDLSLRGEPAIGGNADFRDLIKKVDSVFMGHFEGRKGHWGMYLDTIYMNLSERNTLSVGPGGPILGDLNTDASMKMEIYDIGGLYRVSQPEASVQFDLLAGARYVSVDVSALLTPSGSAIAPISINTGPSETDVMIGGRISGDWSEQWHWTVRGDLSFGGTDGTYNGIAAVGYTFGETGLFSMDLGYRYMSIDLSGTTNRGAPATTDIVLSGPVLGFIFNF